MAAAINYNFILSGDQYGIHDVGLTAWTIRWKTAGWGYRDAAWVWIHTGIFCKILGYGNTYLAEMVPPQYRVIKESGNVYLNKGGDNPGYTSLSRSWAQLNVWWVCDYLAAVCRDAVANPKPYDVGLNIGLLFGTGSFNSSSKYICSEFTWHLLCGIERLVGMRYKDSYSEYTIYPEYRSYVKWRYPGWGGSGIAAASLKKTFLLTPYQQQVNLNTYGGALLYGKEYFVTP